MDKLNDKYQGLLTAIRELGSAAVAFSGGVDSTFLCYAAKEALGDSVIAVTVDSPYIPRWEIEEAKALAELIGIRHVIVEVDSIPESIAHNPMDRCYLCKKAVFGKIIAHAEDLGYQYVMDGSNHDDTLDYRPGMVALAELGVRSPLLETEWTKAEIRQFSKSAGLETHDKPAYACLLTRIPYDEEIRIEDLEKIEKSEVFMMSEGFRAVRVRCHGNLARIEVAREDRSRLFDEALLDKIDQKLKSFGFQYVTLDVSGYRMGSFNKAIGK